MNFLPQTGLLHSALAPQIHTFRNSFTITWNSQTFVNNKRTTLRIQLSQMAFTKSFEFPVNAEIGEINGLCPSTPYLLIMSLNDTKSTLTNDALVLPKRTLPRGKAALTCLWSCSQPALHYSLAFCQGNEILFKKINLPNGTSMFKWEPSFSAPAIEKICFKCSIDECWNYPGRKSYYVTTASSCDPVITFIQHARGTTSASVSLISESC